MNFIAFEILTAEIDNPLQINIICISMVDQEFLFVVLFSVLSFIQT